MNLRTKTIKPGTREPRKPGTGSAKPNHPLRRIRCPTVVSIPPIASRCATMPVPPLTLINIQTDFYFLRFQNIFFFSITQYEHSSKGSLEGHYNCPPNTFPLCDICESIKKMSDNNLNLQDQTIIKVVLDFGDLDIEKVKRKVETFIQGSPNNHALIFLEISLFINHFIHFELYEILPLSHIFLNLTNFI